MLTGRLARTAASARFIDFSIAAAIALAYHCAASPLGAQSPPAKPAPGAPPSSEPRASEPIAIPPMPTLGGEVYWADELVYLDWRIQRNTFSKHCRLIDGDNRRHASGSFETCQTTLEKIKLERKLPPMRGKAVIVLHGLGGVRMLSGDMANFLRDNGAYLTFRISYPSRYENISSHAESLASVIAHLDGVEEINFVAHSMGNLVIRRYWAGVASSPTPDPRIRRVVMIGPPNHGSELAARFDANPLVAKAIGESGQELGSNWAMLAPRLATPGCEFGVIAGGRGDAQGYNPIIEGDDDGLVSVASTRLVGARDFMLTPDTHWRLMRSTEVHLGTLQFLKLGYFTSDERRQPIEK